MMRNALILTTLLAGNLTGCVFGLPPRSAIPDNTPPEVRKNIRYLYWDAQFRAQGCVNLTHLQHQGQDCSAAIPWLIVLLRDDTYAWSPSVFYRYVGTPVCNEAAVTLYSIGPPAIPALEKAIASDDPKLREKARKVLERIEKAHSSSATTQPSKQSNKKPPPGDTH